MKILAFIPARGGSKRFPGKNIHPLYNLPLIAYSIKYAMYNEAHAIVVSTDDPEIAASATSLGAEVIMRPKELGHDESPTIDAAKHALQTMQEKGFYADAFVTLQPTNPLRHETLWKEAFSLFTGETDSVITVSKNNLKLGTISPAGLFTPRTYTPGQRTQDLEPLYYENGLLYITQPQMILNNSLFGDKVQTVITDDTYAIDIDYKHDLDYAENIIAATGSQFTYFL